MGGPRVPGRRGDRLQDEGVWTSLEVTGPAPYLPQGYGGTPEVGCYYLTALVG